MWRYRELLYFLVWRDVKVRYKQTSLGAAWAIIQPVTAMAIFTVIFGRFAKLPSDGVPYPLFSLAALVPWTFFSYGLVQSANSLVASQGPGFDVRGLTPADMDVLLEQGVTRYLEAGGLFGTPETTTLPLLLYQQMAGYRMGAAAVTALLLVLLCLGLFALLERGLGGAERVPARA